MYVMLQTESVKIIDNETTHFYDSKDDQLSIKLGFLWRKQKNQ